jgi:hypothetical protein
MLNELAGIDLSPIAEAITAQAFLSFISLAMGILFLVWILGKCFEVRKSKQYRELMADMYVVGKIKDIAKKEGLDLVKELGEYSKIIKREKLDRKGLDDAIEAELKEKIAKVDEEEKK